MPPELLPCSILVLITIDFINLGCHDVNEVEGMKSSYSASAQAVVVTVDIRVIDILHINCGDYRRRRTAESLPCRFCHYYITMSKW